MNCQEVMELMQRHVDRDLDDQETSRLLNHVGHCPDCAAMLDRLVRLSRGLEQLPRVTPPYSLVDAILPELGKLDPAPAAGELPAGTAAVSPRSRRAERKRNAWIVRLSGVVAAGVVAGLLLINGPFNKGLEGNVEQEAGSAPSAAAPSAAPSSDDTADVSITMKAADEGTAERQEDTEVPQAEPSFEPAEPRSSKGAGEPALEADRSEPAPSSGVELGSSGSGGPVNEPSEAPVESAGEPVPMDPPAIDSGDGQNKGLTTDPSEPVTDDPDAGALSMPPEEAVSPDGRWRAVISDNILRLYDLSVNSMVYESTPDEGTRSNLVWSTDSTAVSYTLTDAAGKQTEIALLVPEAETKE